MAEKLTVIYEARTMPEAQGLKELLQEARIAASIVDEGVLEAAGTDVFGLPVAIRVAVEEAHAIPARRIAIDFDDAIAARVEREMEARDEGRGDEDGMARADRAPEEDEAAASAGPVAWPRCPACDTPRPTRCPLCQTSGIEFSRAELPADAGTAAEPLVLCPECDEPFVPEYVRHCPQCGHEFPDGFEIPSEPLEETFNWRMAAAILAFVAIVGGMIAYFASLFS